MKYLYKYHTHNDLLNYTLGVNNPNVTLCSIDGDKKNDVHFGYVPYDYKIEYLESTGTQWIDTGIGFTQALDIRIQFVLNKLSDGKNSMICGAWADSSSAPKTQFFVNQWNKFAPVTASSTYTAKENNVVINGNNVSQNRKYDVIVSSIAQANSYLNCYLFARNNDVNNRLLYDGLRIYACTMIQNGTVVRDLITVRVGNVGYMYDKITGKLFGNSGTGTFTLGPDIV